MEVNEMKGVEDLTFGENPILFDGRSLNYSSMVAKRNCSSDVIMETKMMIRREGRGGDDDDNDDRNNPSNGSCGFDKETIFPTMISGRAPTNNNNNNNSNVFSPNSTSCYSNDTILDAVEVLDVHRHHQLTVMAERKLRRMISNRESARRSRMRKKKQIEELQYQVGQLEGSNRQLSEKLIQLLECNQQILQENAELKRKVSSLQIILTDFLTPLRNFEDTFCNSNPRAEANSNSSHHLPS